MPGYNAHTYLMKFQQYRRWGGKASLAFDLSEADMFELLLDAFRIIQLESDIGKTKTTANLVADTYTHALPSTILGYKIDSIQVEASGSTTPTTLERRSYEFLENTFDLNDSSPTTGLPLYWAPSKASQRSILIAPAPSYSKTSGVHITASVAPVGLRRIYKGSTGSITISFDLNDTTGTLSAATPVTNGNIQDNDEIGVIRTSDSYGTTTSDLSPRAWYRISDATSTTITLTDTFTEPAASSLNFITAEVHPIELAYPGVLGMLPVKFAWAEWLRFVDPDRAFQVHQEAMAELSKVGGHDERGVIIAAQNIATHYPAAFEE